MINRKINIFDHFDHMLPCFEFKFDFSVKTNPGDLFGAPGAPWGSLGLPRDPKGNMGLYNIALLQKNVHYISMYDQLVVHITPTIRASPLTLSNVSSRSPDKLGGGR